MTFNPYEIFQIAQKNQLDYFSKVNDQGVSFLEKISSTQADYMQSLFSSGHFDNVFSSFSNQADFFKKTQLFPDMSEENCQKFFDMIRKLSQLMENSQDEINEINDKQFQMQCRQLEDFFDKITFASPLGLNPTTMIYKNWLSQVNKLWKDNKEKSNKSSEIIKENYNATLSAAEEVAKASNKAVASSFKKENN